jgi:predicted TIM-barrel fold metal-dependent hydrolase
MVFAGIFERHPRLKVVLTEQTGEWWSATMREYDQTWETLNWAVKDQVPRRPSEYCAEQVFIGGSYLSKWEAHLAVRDGYVANLMWGSDYPHAEGTFQYRDDPDDPSVTHLALRHTFSGIPSRDAKLILSDNALRCYGLDVDALRAVATRINAPTLDELAQPLDAIPDWTVSMAFRSYGMA